MTSKAAKLTLEKEPAARENNTIFMLKPVDQAFAAYYSKNNRSNFREDRKKKQKSS